MRIGDALARWLDDPAAAGDMAAESRRFAEGWAERTARAVAALAGADGEAGVAALLGDHAWADEAIGWAARQLAADPFLDPPLRLLSDRRQRGLVLADGAAATIVATVSFADALGAGAARTVSFTGGRGVIRFVRAGRSRLRLWRIEGERCVAGPVRAIGDGDLVAVDGRREAWSIERADSDIVSLRALMKGGRAAAMREYDRASGMLVRQSAADPDASRAQMMLALLRLMGRRDAGPLFARFCEGGDAHLRWQAMREWIALDPRAALPQLRRMADEEADGPARRTLAMVEARIGEGARCPA